MDRLRKWWARFHPAMRADRDRLRDFLRQTVTWLTERVREAVSCFWLKVTTLARALRDVLVMLFAGAWKALRIWGRRLWVFIGVRGLVLLALVGVAGSISKLGMSGSDPTAQFLLNLGTDLFGAVVVFILLDVFVGTRERLQAEKAELILKMGSDVRDVAVPAAEALRARGWLSNGSLRGAYLAGANLHGARLEYASLQEAYLAGANLDGADMAWVNLQGAILREANLHGAILWSANLQGAHLWRANLQGAILVGANLQGAILVGANLQGAELRVANLQGAYLWRANLRGVNPIGIDFNETTRLPDGTHWTPDTDLARFTNPEHPDFWCFDEPSSSTYRGEASE